MKNMKHSSYMMTKKISVYFKDYKNFTYVPCTKFKCREKFYAYGCISHLLHAWMHNIYSIKCFWDGHGLHKISLY